MGIVYDGDTLRLADGSAVRLAGIDTPELDHKTGRHQPNAVAAHELLERLVAESGNRVRLQPAIEPMDHYGRRLAHVHSVDGGNLQERLLEAGLALVVARPPTLAHLDCYLQAERTARRQGLGLWRSLPVPASGLKPGQVGFTVLSGRVTRTYRSSKSWWVEISDRVSLRIAAEDLGRFDETRIGRLLGREIEARGWLTTHRQGLRLRVRHPAALITLP